VKKKSIRHEKAIKLFGKRVKELRKKHDLSQEQLPFEAVFLVSKLVALKKAR
jgi:hypothetical protein